MNRTILVPLDGSTESEAVLSDVQRIASMRDDVHLLHVLATPNAPAGAETAQALALFEQGMSYLQATREKWLPAQRGVDLVQPGNPAEAILGVALERNAHLIAMTTHARRGLGRFFLGSVALEVVRKAQLPVLLARPAQVRPSRAIQRILMAVEGTEPAQDLLETVKTLAHDAKTEIVLFHAAPAVSDPAPLWAPETKLSILTSPERRLQAQADSLEEQGYVAWPIVTTGEADLEIVKQAVKLEADLIALAPHARAGLARLMEGSVAEKVLRNSPVAVLLQKPLDVRKPVLLGGSHD